MVADMTRSFKSSRKPCWASRASARPRSASSERSWNSSNNTAATPSSIGSSRMSRVKIPSVMISMRVLRDTFEPNRTRRPTISPTRSRSVFAMRSAAARAASLRGSSTRMRRSLTQSSLARTSGTLVVLPAPGGATSTAQLFARKAPVNSGTTASMGREKSTVSSKAVLIGRSPYILVIMPTAQKSSQKSQKPKAATAKAAVAAKSAPAVAGKPLKKGDHLFLVDGSGYIFRAYHALPPINRKSDGLQLNAVFGFCNMLWKLLRDMKPEDRPTHLGVVFDLSEQTFRTEMYPDYKAHRPDPPDDLRPQFPLIRDAVMAFDLPCLEQAGFEADDLIATYVREASEAGATSTIVSSDKDLMQLVGDGVVMLDTMKDKTIGRAEVIEKFGVPPEKVIEVQALIGDSTDNVPGVPGIGVKTAAQLIGEYGDLETLLKRAPEVKQDKRRQSLIENADKARLSKKLVTLDDHVKLDVPVGDLAVHEPDYKRLIAFLKAMEFSSLTRRVAEFSSIDANEVEPDVKLAGKGAAFASPVPGEAGEAQRAAPDEGPGKTPQTALTRPAAPAALSRNGRGEELTPQMLAKARLEIAHNQKF